MAKNIKGRKFVATAATAALVASAIVPVASAAEFADQSKISSWAASAVAHAVDKGYMKGVDASNFNPQGTVTKAQVAQVIYNALGLKAGAPAKFSDVPAGQWFTDAVNALAEKGIASGTDKGEFEPNKDVTLSEAAVMLAKALEIKGTADLSKFADASTVPTWANEAIQALVSKGYITGGTKDGAAVLLPLDTLNRERLATMFVNVAKGELESKSATATKVASVTATNLKEVVVTFDGTVDQETAEDIANYSLKSGKAVKSVALAEDKKTVTITVVGTLANNKADAVSISNVNAGDKVINEKNVAFTAVDNKLPEVTSIKSLGTKSLKVVFSEPVTDLKQTNFTIDGKAYFGKVVEGANNRSVILTPYSTSTLAVGDHEVTISGVKDFAGFVSLSSAHKFTVVEDKDAPTVTEISATLETVTLTFSEDVDAETVSASKVYWKSGDSKKTADEVIPLADNKFKFVFTTTNALPTGKVDIHVEGVKDYSGNEIAKDTKVSVTPEIDQTRPEVRKVTATSETEFKVTFSKSIEKDSAEIEGNYIVKDKDGKVISVKSATVDPTDSKSVLVELYSKLSVGENELTVKNVKDTTKLKNTMLDYTGKIVLGDAGRPTYEAVVKAATSSDDTNKVVLKFSEKMDVDTLTDYSNYLVKIDGKVQTLTGNIADISVSHDGSVVTITFAETINGKKVVFDAGSATAASGNVNINELSVLGVKDLAGNLLKEFVDSTNIVYVENGSTRFTLAQVNSDEDVKYKAELVDRKTVKVKFSTVINSAAKGAFTSGTSNSITDVEVNGTSTVTLKFKENLKTDGSDLDLDIDFSKLVDIAGNQGSATNNTTISIANDNLLDSVAPVRVGDAVVAGETITLSFSEALDENAGSVNELLRSDFTIVRVSDNKELSIKDGYSVALANDADGVQNKVVITLTDTSKRTDDTHYKITVDGAKYIIDGSDKENAIANFTVTTKTKVTSGTTLSIAAARQAVTDAQAAVATATTNLATATADAATAATDLTAAQTAAATADAALIAAQADAAAADAALTADPTNATLLAAKTAADAAVTTAQTAKTAADAAVTAAQTAKTAADAAVTAAQTAKTAADADLAAAQAALAALLA